MKWTHFILKYGITRLSVVTRCDLWERVISRFPSRMNSIRWKRNAAATRIKFNEKRFNACDSRRFAFQPFRATALVFWKTRILWRRDYSERVRRCASLISVVFTAANKRLSKTCFTTALLYRREFTRNIAGNNGCELTFKFLFFSPDCFYLFNIKLSIYHALSRFRRINKYEYYFTHTHALRLISKLHNMQFALLFATKTCSCGLFRCFLLNG